MNWRKPALRQAMRYPSREADLRRCQESRERTQAILKRDGCSTVGQWNERKRQEFMRRGADKGRP